MAGLFVGLGFIIFFLESLSASIRMSCNLRCVVSKTVNKIVIESDGICDDDGKIVQKEYIIPQFGKKCIRVLDNAYIRIAVDVGWYTKRFNSKELYLECSGYSEVKCENKS